MSNNETNRKLVAACQEVWDAMYRAEHVLSNPRSRGGSKAKAELLTTAANLEAMAVELSPKLSTTVDRVVRAAHELGERVAAPRKGEKPLEAMTLAGKVLQRSLTDLYDTLNPPPRTPMEKLDRLERDVKTALLCLRPLRKSHQEMGWPNSEYPNEDALAYSYSDDLRLHDRAMEIAEKLGLPSPPSDRDPEPLQKFRKWVHESRIQVRSAGPGAQTGRATGSRRASDSLVDSEPKATKGVTRELRARCGRPQSSDAKEDERIADAWATKRYRTFADLDRELTLTAGTTKRALDRHRHRKSK